jgi:hypothetical protein
MIDIKVIVLILLIHFLADFALQTDEQAKKKSTSVKWLSYHIATYTFCMGLMAFYLFPTWNQVIIFTLFTYVSHFITDYITSRMGKPFWEKGNHHDGFVVIGGDQVIHYICLFGSYLYLS